MNFYDVLGNKHEHHDNFEKQNDHDNNRYFDGSHQSNYEKSDHFEWQNIWAKINSNKKLKQLVMIAAIFIIVILIALIIALFPYLTKLISSISQNGLQGALDSISVFLEKIGKLTGK